MHLKRLAAPKIWPVKRKTSTYIVRPGFSFEKGIPVLIILRDLLKITQNKKEVKKALHLKQILLNNKPVREVNHSAMLFDIIKIVPMKKSYRIDIGPNKKFEVSEIKENESERKISKIIDKKILKGKKTQLNLSDGNNFLSDVKCETNDSVVIDLKNKKIEKCLPLKENSKIIVFEGKHSGKRGVVNKIDYDKKMAELDISKEKINVLIKQIMVTD